MKQVRTLIVFILLLIAVLAVSIMTGNPTSTSLTDLLRPYRLTGGVSGQPAERETRTVSEYQLVVKDLNWEQARQEAEQLGGHLAVIDSEEEWQQIRALLEKELGSKKHYIWLGASRAEEETEFHWVTGETVDLGASWWDKKEPSYKDGGDGVQETCLCAWNVHKEWKINDQRQNILSVVSKGTVGMLVEIEREVEV